MEKQIKYSIDYPVAAEITLAAAEEDKLQQFCLEGLKLAVKEQRMEPEQARTYFNNWFGADYDFSVPASEGGRKA